MAHLTATDVVAEGRWYAHNYLKTVALDLPEAKEPLRRAAELFRDEHDLVWEMWRAGGSWHQLTNESVVRNFAGATVRHQLADMVLDLRDMDAAAAQSIDESLTILIAFCKSKGTRMPIYGR
jgi:hypothetical protein